MKPLAVTMLALVFVGLVLAWQGVLPKVDERRIAIWKRSLERAETARQKGETYRALTAYAHAARMAAAGDDWEGLLAAACGMEKIGRTEGPSLNAFNVLIQAMGAAERKQSTEGLETVANAFVETGKSFASFAMSRIHKGRTANQRKWDSHRRLAKDTIHHDRGRLDPV